MVSQDFFKNLVMLVALSLSVIIALVAIHMADVANSRANKLSLKVNNQQEALHAQAYALDRILNMAGAHQDLIAGIIDNQEGIMKLVTKKNGGVRSTARSAP